MISIVSPKNIKVLLHGPMDITGTVFTKYYQANQRMYFPATATAHPLASAVLAATDITGPLLSTAATVPTACTWAPATWTLGTTAVATAGSPFVA